MKRSIFLSIILSLFLVACIPQAMAQKQSRLEKLLRYLNDNDVNPEKPDVPLNKNDAFQKVQKRHVQEKR